MFATITVFAFPPRESANTKTCFLQNDIHQASQCNIWIGLPDDLSWPSVHFFFVWFQGLAMRTICFGDIHSNCEWEQLSVWMSRTLSGNVNLETPGVWIPLSMNWGNWAQPWMYWNITTHFKLNLLSLYQMLHFPLRFKCQVSRTSQLVKDLLTFKCQFEEFKGDQISIWRTEIFSPQEWALNWLNFSVTLE